MKSTTNNQDNFQNKHTCMWKTIYITNHSKNKNHVKNAWKSRWISQFSRKVFHNIITHCSCSLSLLLFQKLLLCWWISVCRIFFFCKMWQFIVLIVIVFLGIFVCIMLSLLCVCMIVVFVFFVYDVFFDCCVMQTMSKGTENMKSQI